MGYLLNTRSAAIQKMEKIFHKEEKIKLGVFIMREKIGFLILLFRHSSFYCYSVCKRKRVSNYFWCLCFSIFYSFFFCLFVSRRDSGDLLNERE